MMKLNPQYSYIWKWAKVPLQDRSILHIFVRVWKYVTYGWIKTSRNAAIYMSHGNVLVRNIIARHLICAAFRSTNAPKCSQQRTVFEEDVINLEVKMGSPCYYILDTFFVWVHVLCRVGLFRPSYIGNFSPCYGNILNYLQSNWLEVIKKLSFHWVELVGAGRIILYLLIHLEYNRSEIPICIYSCITQISIIL